MVELYLKNMKNILTFLLVIGFLASMPLTTQAQSEEGHDTIYKVTNDIIVCTIVELNTTEVKYSYPDRPNIVLAIENELVDYIQLKTGEIIKPENNDKEISDIAYAKQKSMNAKLGILTPLQGYTELGFEYNLKPQHSIETTLGIIGLGSDGLSTTTDRGASLSAGYKVYASPDFHLRKVRNAHRMNGLYVQPTVALSYHTARGDVQVYDPINFTWDTENVSSSIFKGAFLLKIGKQYIFSDIFSVDLNVGVGYGIKDVHRIDSPNEESGIEFLFDYEPSYGSRVFERSGFAMSSSLKVGVLLK